MKYHVSFNFQAQADYEFPLQLLKSVLHVVFSVVSTSTSSEASLDIITQLNEKCVGN